MQVCQAHHKKLVFSVPFDEDNFATGSGARSIKVDDTIVGLKTFRSDLFIFCENRIFKLTGSTVSDFAISAVTRRYRLCKRRHYTGICR